MALSTEPGRRYTYADLAAFPDDNLRREIIDGELIVNPSPVIRHQIASMNIAFHLEAYKRSVGGRTLAAPMDVLFDDRNVVEPDAMFFTAGRAGQVEGAAVRITPDLVIEISSPSTHRLDTGRKLKLYERFGVPEYWFVDLEAERVEIYELNEGRYRAPRMVLAGEVLESRQLAGFRMPASEALGAEPEG